MNSTPGATVHTATAAERGHLVELRGLERHFGEVKALDGLDLTLTPGEMVVLLGPSGCGKTTALRILAGLDRPDAGQVLVAGKDLTSVPANRRDMGMVFQAYSLFPHLTVVENVAFGLKLRGRRKAARKQRAGDMLDLVGLGAHHDRYPWQLSGGQQQRVALARALAFEPSVLLLDEPLSALDAKVRVQLRDEIRRVQQEVGATTLFVTHDQEEALAVADRVGVMNAGRLEQLATPADLYGRPATPFVGQFVGLSNRVPVDRNGESVRVLGRLLPVLPGSVAGHGDALVRPECLDVTAQPDGGAVVVNVAFLGSISRVTCRLADDTEVVAQLPSAQAAHLRPGERVEVTVSDAPVMVLPSSAAPERAAVV
ncbi:ABC transporter ATP-binding protein [Nocardioides yefusunii]|uniref:ABC transporter ATP-binding protein n=1 Tax=Nocardioides yefusunii TaxID=2500546 RepID=A0ABW1QVZ5_9ACTN|nr:ABC transporter ATP-binding protein [Nocardioides yefusunii]